MPTIYDILFPVYTPTIVLAAFDSKNINTVSSTNNTARKNMKKP